MLKWYKQERKPIKFYQLGFSLDMTLIWKRLKEIVQSGQLGNVYYIETGGGRRRGMPGGTFINKELAGAGAMADIGCYSLDLALNALGYPKPLSVSAYTSNHFGTNPAYHAEADKFEVEDFGVAIVRLEGGKVLNFKISWAMHMDSLDRLFSLARMLVEVNTSWKRSLERCMGWRNWFNHTFP